MPEVDNLSVLQLKGCSSDRITVKHSKKEEEPVKTGAAESTDSIELVFDNLRT